MRAAPRRAFVKVGLVLFEMRRALHRGLFIVAFHRGLAVIDVTKITTSVFRMPA
jgi:hypothetical protein